MLRHAHLCGSRAEKYAAPNDGVHAFCRGFGFRRTSDPPDERTRSLLNELLRGGLLEKNGRDRIRRV